MPATATVVDTTGHYTGDMNLLARNVVAGFAAWEPFLAPTAGIVDIELRLVETGVERANGSGALVAIGTNGPLTVYGQVGAMELLTGRDANGSAADIVINLNITYSATADWLNPLDGSRPPSFRSDLVSVFAHEIGHGLGFIGFRDWSTYALSGSVATVFDQLVQVVDGKPFFTGVNAAAFYGGVVPLTIGDLFHVGNAATSAALRSDLMNGFTFNYGTTPVSQLDGRILSDLGIPTIFADNLRGTTANDTINGGDGADTVVGDQGDDVILGGAGANYLRGDTGSDSIVGGANFDDINGNQGDDILRGGEGFDWVVGGQANDMLYGENGGDIVYGNLGNDTQFGGDGFDWVRGGQGSDSVDGGAGDDLMWGDRGDDTVTGGAGADMFHIFTGGGLDRVTDFSYAQGDRVVIDYGTYTVSQVGSDTVVDLGGGDRMVLVGVTAAGLPVGWITTL